MVIMEFVCLHHKNIFSPVYFCFSSIEVARIQGWPQ